MSFIEPALLWGALAVGIPIAIHFWHQKRGKLMPWAVTQWLTEANQQQSRGLRLDNILLLLVRCLLLLLLALLLSQPILNGLKAKAAVRTVHLIQPSAPVVDNFRFELEEALRRGDAVYWVGEEPEPVRALTSLPTASAFSPLRLQTAIDRQRRDGVVLHLYLLNNPTLATVPAIYVPEQFKLHTVAAPATPERAYLTTKTNQKLFVNDAGRLIRSATPTVRLRVAPVLAGPLRVLLDYRNPAERQTVRAALDALADVYALALRVDEKVQPAIRYNWVLTDQPVRQPLAQTLYVVSGPAQYPGAANVLYTHTSLTPQTDERVASGQLPAWLGERLLAYYGLTIGTQPLSQPALAALFVAENRPDSTPQPVVHRALLLVFIGLLTVERWLALTRNA